MVPVINLPAIKTRWAAHLHPARLEKMTGRVLQVEQLKQCRTPLYHKIGVLVTSCITRRLARHLLACDVKKVIIVSCQCIGSIICSIVKLFPKINA